MSKKWYNYFVSVEPEGSSAPENSPPGEKQAAGNAAQAVADIAASVQIQPHFPSTVTSVSSFDEIYHAAEIKPLPHGYTVAKVAAMLASPHIRELPAEIKRSSVMVALEAAGAKVQDIIEDAVRRDKALDAFETVQRRALEQLESAKTEENRQIQAEMDRLVAEHRARIQANNDQITRERDKLNAWLREKHKEERQIADTVGHFVSENPVSVSGSVDKPAQQQPNPVRDSKP